MPITRTIEQILQIRKRAAELWVQERSMAVLKIQETIQQALWPDEHQQELGRLTEAIVHAQEALASATREIESQQGLPVEQVIYESAVGDAVHCYAAVLMFDDPALVPERALEQAYADETARFADYYARFGQPDDDFDQA